jgi:hypothetical protein
VGKNLKVKFVGLSISLLLIFQGLQSQFYETGQSPASLRWRQINTKNFRLIYPETWSARAHELAGILEEARVLAGHTLDHAPRRIPVIVHNHHARSNGLVVWAPRRMELYPVPPQSIRGGHWLTQLAVHETRHVVQVDKLHQGPVRFFSWLLGEQAVGLSAGRIPEWFYEGDAIIAETALTFSGRGRMPSFYMPFRALLLSGRDYHYDKYLHGSFRDYVPDSYQYGYQVVSALRRDRGPGFWEVPIDYTARRPWHPAPFYGAIRSEAGNGMSDVHERVVAGIRDEWMALHETRDHMDYESINSRAGDLYLSYRYPAWSGDSAVIALKSGIAVIDEIVRLHPAGEEESIHFPGVLSAPVISVSGSRIAWSEFRPDLRWGLNTHSIIRVFDMDGDRQARALTSQSRYFAPSFDRDGLLLAVIENMHGNQDRLVLLNSVSGEVAEIYDAPPGESLQRPVFSADGNHILLTSVSRAGNSILSVDRATGLWTSIRGPSLANVSGVFPCGGMVCFHTDFTGIDNIFAMDPGSGAHFQVTWSRFGGMDGSLDPSGRRLVWSDYTADGFDLSIVDFEPDIYGEWEEKDYFRGALLETLIGHEKGIMTAAAHDTARYSSLPYRKSRNLFNFHSWSPFYYDYRDFNIEQLPVYPGITLISQDLLNTANTNIGYSYRSGNHVLHGSFIYKGWFPVLQAGFDYGDEPVVLMGRDTIGPPATGPEGRLSLHGTVSVPLNLASGRYHAGLEPLLRINYHNLLYHAGATDTYERGLGTIQARILAWRYSRRSHRDLAPPWGQVLRLQRSGSPFEQDLLGSVTAAGLTLYFPGLMAHHSLRLEGVMQWQRPRTYYFSNLVTLPRGYPTETRGDMRLLKVGYSFPFLYPDLSFPLPGVIYLKRLHAGLFAEGGTAALIASNGIPTGDEGLFSWGATVTTHLFILRAPFPFNITTGFARIPSRDEFSFLFSLGVDLGAF